MPDFVCEVIRCWEEFYETVREMAPSEPSEAPPWLYRGQTHDHPLTTTLERVLGGWGIDLEEASAIEFLFLLKDAH